MLSIVHKSGWENSSINAELTVEHGVSNNPRGLVEKLIGHGRDIAEGLTKRGYRTVVEVIEPNYTTAPYPMVIIYSDGRSRNVLQIEDRTGIIG